MKFNSSMRPGGFLGRDAFSHPWLLAFCIFTWQIAGAFGSSVTNSAAHWPSLKEVLAKWDAVSLATVEKKADAGELTAQHYLGYCYTEGHRTPADPALGVSWYLRAGNAGYMPSLSNLGYLYQCGMGVPRDDSKMLQFYHRAVDGGYVPAMRYIGISYRDGNGVARNYTEAMRWFRRAAEDGDTPAMVEIGRLYRFGEGVPEDSDEALRWFQKAADHNDALAQLNLGLLDESEGNATAAFKLYRRAAEQGSGDAMFKMYECYRDGTGVTADFSAAKTWLEKGANAGSVTAQCELGWLCENPPYDPKSNLSAPPRMAEAVKWYRRAADRNHAPSQYYLGLCYIQGKGVEQDEERGLELVRQAADQGLVSAVFDLAGLYAAGVGEPRNVQEEPLQLWEHVTVIYTNDQEYGYSKAGAAYQQIIFHLLSGLGTQRDLVAAAAWYCRAAIAGMQGYSLNTSAQLPTSLRRAFDYYSGPSDSDRHWVHLCQVDVGQFDGDFFPVLALYLEAARTKKPSPCLQIARMYATGDEVPQSLVKAWSWFTLAIQNGDTDARSKRDAIEAQMTGNELEQAQKSLPDLVRDLNRVAMFDANRQGNWNGR